MRVIYHSIMTDILQTFNCFFPKTISFCRTYLGILRVTVSISFAISCFELTLSSCLAAVWSVDIFVRMFERAVKILILKKLIKNFYHLKISLSSNNHLVLSHTLPNQTSNQLTANKKFSPPLFFSQRQVEPTWWVSSRFSRISLLEDIFLGVGGILAG